MTEKHPFRLTPEAILADRETLPAIGTVVTWGTEGAEWDPSGSGGLPETPLAVAHGGTAGTTAAAARAALGVDQVLNRTGVKTSAYPAVAGDLVPVDVTAGTVVITLPLAPVKEQQLQMARAVVRVL